MGKIDFKIFRVSFFLWQLVVIVGSVACMATYKWAVSETRYSAVNVGLLQTQIGPSSFKTTERNSAEFENAGIVAIVTIIVGLLICLINLILLSIKVFGCCKFKVGLAMRFSISSGKVRKHLSTILGVLSGLILIAAVVIWSAIVDLKNNYPSFQTGTSYIVQLVLGIVTVAISIIYAVANAKLN